MPPRVQPIDATLGAVVTGLELARMDTATWTAVERAFHEHAVLVFPGQDLTEAEQIAFAQRWGDLELLAPDPSLKAVAISNQKPDGTIMGPDEHRYKSLRGNEGWHTDSSYMPLAAKASILSAQVVPSAAGETEWADMRAAYEALDEATRRRIAGLSAHHSLYHSQAAIGHIVKPGAGYGFHTKGAPLRPLVKVHPVTGRPALFIGRHAHAIPGLDPAESEKLLAGRPGDLGQPLRAAPGPALRLPRSARPASHARRGRSRHRAGADRSRRPRGRVRALHLEPVARARALQVRAARRRGQPCTSRICTSSW